MGEERQGTVRWRGRGGMRRTVEAAVVVGALVGWDPGVRGAAEAADARPAGLALTLSGLASAPRGERSMRVHGGAGIRFRAPASGQLAWLQTFWRRRTAGCEVSLHEDAGRALGNTLASEPIPDGAAGWVAVPLAADVRAGEAYHVVITCPGGRRARLGYVIDADRSARAIGAWRLEGVGRRRGRVHRRSGSPLFALVFADGTWWGQPYRPIGARPSVRVCARHEMSAVLVPTRPLLVTDVEVPHARGVRFTLSAEDGATVLAGPRSETGAAPSSPATLSAGTPYTLRLRTGRGRRCYRARALVTDLALGPGLSGLGVASLSLSHDAGRTWQVAPGATVAVRLIGSNAPLAACGNDALDPGEECDGSVDGACPGRCTSTCTCRPNAPSLATCGNGRRDAGEECDGTADGACPGRCTETCTCGAPAGRSYRSIYGAGYFGAYDSGTIAVWPERLGLILGGPDGQGPLVAGAKRAAASAGNGDARFVFYMSLTSLDSGCACSDAHLYQNIAASHPDWILRDGAGRVVSTFVSQIGPGRQIAIDIGNPAVIDAWASWAFAAMDRYGWDGVFADNVVRGTFYGWSATPVNPRTGTTYTVAQYRADMLAALERLRGAFDARGKIFVGNHTGGWESFDDPVIQSQIIAMHGVELEGCYLTAGGYYSEGDWIAQTRYLDFANAHGVMSMCNGVGAIGGSSSRRAYLLASYLLTKEGFSNVAELNTTGDWWDGLAVDLGAPLGHFTCLDPASGLASASSCPSPGKIYVREWEHGRVLVNPTAGTTVTVPLGGTFVAGGTPVTSVTLSPQTGVVLQPQ